MRMRRSAAAVALAVAVTVPTAVTGVAAYAQASAPTAASVHAAKKPKPDKKTNFQASGTVTAVDVAGGKLTVAARSGTKDVRGKTVTMSVAAGARIVLNGKKVKLDALVAGLRVSVTGTRSDIAYLAGKIQAAGKVKPGPSPTPTASPSPGDTPAPEPSQSSSPTESPEPSGSSEPTGSPEPSED
jgi:phage baseplate assembly protein gpV